MVVDEKKCISGRINKSPTPHNYLMLREHQHKEGDLPRSKDADTFFGCPKHLLEELLKGEQ